MLPVSAGGASSDRSPATSNEQRAVWLSTDIIAWNVDDPDATYTLFTSRRRWSWTLEPGGVSGGGEGVELEWVSDSRCRRTLPPSAIPHLADYAGAAGARLGRRARGVEAAPWRWHPRPGTGRAPAATGLQIGPTCSTTVYAGRGDRGRPGNRLGRRHADPAAVGADRPKSVTLHRFDDPEC